MRTVRTFIRKHRRKLTGVIVVAVIICLHMPIPVKQAAEIVAVVVDKPVNFDTLVGSSVTLLCRRADFTVTDPPDYGYYIVGILKDDVFLQWEISSGAPCLYVYPKWFVGLSVQNFPGGLNRFIFRGILENATAHDGKDGDYRIRLTSWDIVAPIHRGDFDPPGQKRADYEYLFLRDFWLP